MKNLLKKSPRASIRKNGIGYPVGSIAPVIVRDLQGNILHWNYAAERSYGWSKAQALGNVSHQLLETIFPEALEEINSQLVNSGSWKGELIHSLSDGSRVRVRSRWELITDEKSLTTEVMEINHHFEEIKPESAHFTEKSLREQFFGLFRDKRTWLAIVLVIILLVEITIELNSQPLGFPSF